MARQVAEVTTHSQGYGKILGLTLLAICGGIFLICLEMTEYGWQSEAKVSPAPKVQPIPPFEPVGNAGAQGGVAIDGARVDAK